MAWAPVIVFRPESRCFVWKHFNFIFLYNQPSYSRTDNTDRFPYFFFKAQWNIDDVKSKLPPAERTIEFYNAQYGGYSPGHVT
jgi:hypothetical protein